MNIKTALVDWVHRCGSFITFYNIVQTVHMRFYTVNLAQLSTPETGYREDAEADQKREI